MLDIGNRSICIVLRRRLLRRNNGRDRSQLRSGLPHRCDTKPYLWTNNWAYVTRERDPVYQFISHNFRTNHWTHVGSHVWTDFWAYESRKRRSFRE